jgi:hypothetical protein
MMWLRLWLRLRPLSFGLYSEKIKSLKFLIFFHYLGQRIGVEAGVEPQSESDPLSESEPQSEAEPQSEPHHLGAVLAQNTVQ